METMTQPKITGYRQLDEQTAELINAIKQNGNELGALFETLSGDPSVDQRWLAIAKTELQKGFMFLVRAVARPDGF